jgi:predicted neuraminidase
MNFRGLSIALLLCVCADAAWRVGSPQGAVAAPRFAVTASTSPTCNAPVVLQQGRLPMPENTPAAHASTLVALDERHPLGRSKSMVAFWFAGSRESGPDVGIAASTYDRERQAWDPAQWVVTRDSVASQLGVAVRRIGNPVAWRDGTGRLHLYVVATGLGGWAASRVVHLVEGARTGSDAATASSPSRSPSPLPSSPDAPNTLTFVAQRVMPTMPLATWFNTSTLVRAVPVDLQDGGAWLPMYFELGTKYPLAVRLDRHGELLDVRRMSQRHDVLQPTLVATSPTDAAALMRDSGPQAHVAWSQTRDGGWHWQDQPNAAAGNPDSSLAAVRLPSGEWLVAHNPLQDRRRVLLLSVLRDPQQPWRSVPLVQGPEGSEFSYPSVWVESVTSASDTVDAQVWVTYTDQRQAIAYARLKVRCTGGAHE